MKPYVKRQKNDMVDAEAICEAVTRADRPSLDRTCTGRSRQLSWRLRLSGLCQLCI
jgi:transposase